MQPIMLVAVDVRRAEKAGSSRANIVDKLTIPPIRFSTADHNPGGGVMGVSYVLPRIEAPEPAFATKGIDTDIFDGFGEVDKWVFAGAYHSQRHGVLPARCVIEGAIAEWAPDESSPVEFQGCNHIFRQVMHFELFLDGKELWYIDSDERIMRRNGRDLYAPVRQALGA